MKKISIHILISCMITLACSNPKKEKDMEHEKKENFDFVLEQFADLRILRYQVPGFDGLTLEQKKLIYYLNEAAKCGRDILWDQNGKYNLAIRQALENIYHSYAGDKTEEQYKDFLIYLKRVWFSNGIYHHYSTDKMLPNFTKEYFNTLVQQSDSSGWPTINGKGQEETLDIIKKVMFDKDYLPKKVSQAEGKDLIKNSAVNFYGENITEKEVIAYYDSIKSNKDNTPVSYGLNTKIVRDNGSLKEITWKKGGMYGNAIDTIIYWLEQALPFAETQEQTLGIEKLISYYRSGDLETWDEYNILWVKDTSRIDFINGFVETYSDPLGMTGTWEAIVNFKDLEATKRTEIIAENAQWFEDNSPIDDKFKKEVVKGVSAKVINVTTLGGDCYPHTPIGINLPNSNWIREIHGSKSVTIENITYAYNQASLGSGFLEEFSADEGEIELVKKYSAVSDNLHTDLHECLGHGSGKLLPNVSQEDLKNYQAPLEETRADLFALYYMMDEKMLELGLLPSLDAAKAHYISYFRNGLMTQLKRIEPGNNIHQAHMRNRQLISKWCYEKGKDDKVIEKIVKDGNTFYKIHDFVKLRNLIADLLIEVQRIKSEGDYEAGKALVENYGVKVDPKLHAEVLERFEKLDLAPYSGFLNPEYKLIKDDNGQISDIEVEYVDDYTKQMLKYGREYSYLPVWNQH